MAKNLPDGFTSWIQFFDYINDSKPEILKARSISFMAYQPDGSVREAYKISTAILMRNCWLELQELRDKQHKSEINKAEMLFKLKLLN